VGWSLKCPARLTSRWSASVSYSSLAETNGMLGSTYDGAGLLTLGDHHKSSSVSLSSSYDLGGGRGVLVDATLVSTNGATMNSGLIRDVSAIKARAYGVSFIQADALTGGDRLTLSVRKPLRVVSGTASLAVTSVDSDGYASTVFAPVSLAPNGNETDVSVGYSAPLSASLHINGGLDLKQDARNIAGAKDVGLRMGMNFTF